MSLLLLFLVICIGIQLPFVQNWVKQAAFSYLESKTGGQFTAEKFGFTVFGDIWLEDCVILDRNEIFFLEINKLETDVSMSALWKGNIHLEDLFINDLSTALIQEADSSWNYDFLIDGFAASNEKEAEGSAVSNFSLGLIELQAINFLYKDELKGDSVLVVLGSFSSDMSDSKIPGAFIFENTKLDELNANVLIHPTQSSTGNSQLPVFNIGEVSINNSSLEYSDGESILLNASIPEGTIDSKVLDLNDGAYIFDNIDVNDPNITITQWAKADKSDTVSPFYFPELLLGLESTTVQKGNFSYQSFQNDTVQLEFSMDDLEAELEGLTMMRDSFDFSITSLAFQLNKQPYPINLTAKGKLNTNQTWLENLQVTMDKGSITINGIAPPVLGAYLDETFGKGKSGKLNVSGTNITPEKLLRSFYKIEEIPEKYLNISKQKLSFQTVVSLEKDYLTVPSFDLNWDQTLLLQAKGSSHNPWHQKQLTFDLDIQQGVLQAKTIQLINGLADSLTDLRDNILVSADLTGTISTFDGRATIATERNQVDLIGQLDVNKQAYKVKGDISAGNYVHLIKREGFPSQIDGSIEIEGQGFDPDTMQLQFETSLQEFEWKDYSYKKIAASGTYNKGLLEALLNIDDPNLSFNFSAKVDTKDSLNDINAKGHLKKANLQALHLSENIYDLTAFINADIKGNDPSRLNGFVNLDDIILQTADTLYKADSIRLLSSYNEGFSNISLLTDFLDFRYSGDIPLTSLPDYALLALKDHIPMNQPLKDSLSRYRSGIVEFELSSIGNISSLLIPGLSKIEALKGKFELTEVDSSFSGSLNVENINYQGFSIHQTRLGNTINRDSFEASIVIDSIKGSGVNLPQTTIEGHLRNDTVHTRLTIGENDTTAIVRLVASLFKNKDQFHLSLKPGLQIINKEKWRINKGNFIEVSKGLDYKGNLKLYNGEKYFQIVGNGKGDSISNYKINFQNLEIEGFTYLMAEEYQALDGFISGTVGAKGVFRNPIVKGNITVAQFAYENEVYGDLNFTMQKDTANQYRVAVKGSGDWIDLNGKVDYAQKTDEIKGSMQITRLGIEPVEPLLKSYVDSLKGVVRGDIDISGTGSKPVLDGRIELSNMAASVISTNTRYNLPKGSVSFENENIKIQSLVFQDKEGNKGTLSGTVTVKSLDEYNYDLDFQSNKFLFLDTRKVAELTYYGEVQSSARLDIIGSTNQTVVDGIIVIDEGTSFKMALPEVTRYDKKEGLVKFVDRDAEKLPLEQAVSSDSRQGGFENHQLEINTRLEINEKASLTIIMDQQSEDQLQVAGSGNLVFRMEKSGYMSMNGNYQVTSGKYNFSFYKLIRRDFRIQSGSSLTWTGDPLNPSADITGIYRVEASPKPLLPDQQTATSRLPFEVTMEIKGPIQAPDIDYALRLPNEVSSPLKSTINSRLSLINRQQNEKSKQVFGLLVLSSFLTPDNQTADNSFANTAYRSLSEMLSTQLNQLSKKYIKGVDINLGVDLTDNANTLPEAQVSLNLQKALFDENVIVSVGGNYQNRDNPNASNLTTDIKVTYKLTKDGRFQLSVFRKGEYEGDIEGDVIKTGVTLVFMKNFDKFKEIFENTKKDKETPW